MRALARSPEALHFERAALELRAGAFVSCSFFFFFLGFCFFFIIIFVFFVFLFLFFVLLFGKLLRKFLSPQQQYCCSSGSSCGKTTR